MAERLHLDWFRERLAATAALESKDPLPILQWREEKVRNIAFQAELIGLDRVRGWQRDNQGNICHSTGQFFAIEGVRIESGHLREVGSWDQPIYTQPSGGVLAMLAREVSGHGIQFLLQAKAEPGNLGILQLCPSIQCTWSNIERAHAGRNPPLVEVFFAKFGVRVIYRAQHNEEGGRFWQKSNENMIVFVDDDAAIHSDLTMFCWASLSQIKELALLDNFLSPFVKTILAPI